MGLLTRRTFLSFLLASPGLCTTRAQAAPKPWNAQNSGVLTRLLGVFFADRKQGWIVGSNGLLLTTKDGGTVWERQTPLNREVLRDVHFLDSQRGFVLGEYTIFNRPASDVPKSRSFLLMSDDSGKSWNDIALFNEDLKANDPKRYNGSGIVRLFFVDDRTGWACGEAGLMLVTRDAGRTWLRQPLPINKLFFDVTALDESNAWTAGGGGVVLRTVDGGKNWNEQTTGVTKTLRGIHFIDSKRGWAVGSEGTIMATINGGNKWQLQAAGITENLNAVYFTSKTEGWAAGDRGVLLHTTNAGAQWERVPLKTRSDLTRFFFIAPDCGWVIGTNGAIFKYQP
ncbi:MAG TPA: YCF48-related protein [Blastocatellia bacterium]|nr:YCF48-related protein [Blastocatellia bacterium]